MPFLSSYPLNSVNPPFMLQDLGQPFCVVQAWLENNGIIIYESAAFSALFDPQQRTLGQPVDHYSYRRPQTKAFLKPHRAQRTACPISQVLPIEHVTKTKDGTRNKLTKVQGQVQFLYLDGEAAWGVVTAEAVIEEHLCRENAQDLELFQEARTGFMNNLLSQWGLHVIDPYSP